jgi:putative transcriptional regulator
MPAGDRRGEGILPQCFTLYKQYSRSIYFADLVTYAALAINQTEARTMTLAEYRKRQGMTQAEIAERIGRDTATVCRYEKGTRIPDLRTIRKIKAVTNGAVAEDDWAAEESAA